MICFLMITLKIFCRHTRFTFCKYSLYFLHIVEFSIWVGLIVQLNFRYEVLKIKFPNQSQTNIYREPCIIGRAS